MTLEEVGNIVGVGKSTVRKWETGDIANMKIDKVTLLAFMGDEWAYVQIGLEGRVCRLFIPRSALSQN